MSAFSTSLENMLDIQFIREHADVVKESQRKRGESVELVDEVLRSDEVRRSSLKEFEAARAQQKEIGKKVAAAPADEKAKLIAETKELSQKVSEYKAAADRRTGRESRSRAYRRAPLRKYRPSTAHQVRADGRFRRRGS